jgi:hypothetical protein
MPFEQEHSTAMGILLKAFLTGSSLLPPSWHFVPSASARRGLVGAGAEVPALQQRFGACANVVEDLKGALSFWDEVRDQPFRCLFFSRVYFMLNFSEAMRAMQFVRMVALLKEESALPPERFIEFDQANRFLANKRKLLLAS